MNASLNATIRKHGMSRVYAIIRQRDELINLLSRYGRHDRDCPASGECNCDSRCTCGLKNAIERQASI